MNAYVERVPSWSCPLRRRLSYYTRVVCLFCGRVCRGALIVTRRAARHVAAERERHVAGPAPRRAPTPLPLPCFTTVVTRTHCCTSRPSPLAHCCALHIVALRPIVAADVVSVYDVYFCWNSCCSRYACESFKYSCFHFLKLLGSVQCC